MHRRTVDTRTFEQFVDLELDGTAGDAAGDVSGAAGGRPSDAAGGVASGAASGAVGTSATAGAGLAFRARFLNQSVYAPHVERWFRAFPRESFLIIRAEDLFEDEARAVRELFAFLGLREADLVISRRNAGRYESALAPGLRARLREYFKPHNERLYELLGRDMHWS